MMILLIKLNIGTVESIHNESKRTVIYISYIGIAVVIVIVIIVFE